MIRPAIAPLFFFKRFQAAGCDKVDATFMRGKDTTKLFYPATLPFKTSKKPKPTGNNRIYNMQGLEKWKQGQKVLFIVKFCNRIEEHQFNDRLYNEDANQRQPERIHPETCYKQGQQRTVKKVHQEQGTENFYIIILRCLACPANTLARKLFPCFWRLCSDDHIF